MIHVGTIIFPYVWGNFLAAELQGIFLINTSGQVKENQKLTFPSRWHTLEEDVERTRLNVQCLLLQLQNSHPLIHQMSNENMIPVEKKEMKLVLQIN